MTVLPKIICKLQIFLVMLKLSGGMSSLWVNILTPTWLFGSAVIGCIIYSSAQFLLKLAIFVFMRKLKDESRLSADSVLSYLMVTLFLASQITGILGLIFSSQIIQQEMDEQHEVAPLNPRIALVCIVVPMSLMLLLGVIFCLSHRLLRRYILELNFQPEKITDSGTGEKKSTKIKVRYPLFLVVET